MLTYIQLDPHVAKLLATTEVYDNYWATEEGLDAQKKIAESTDKLRPNTSQGRRRVKI
jgi:hypothetical protein